MTHILYCCTQSSEIRHQQHISCGTGHGKDVCSLVHTAAEKHECITVWRRLTHCATAARIEEVKTVIQKNSPVSYHLCKHTCFPGESSVTSGPCLHEIYPPATRTASPSADPGAASWSSGSLCGRGYYCKASRHMEEHCVRIYLDAASALFKNINNKSPVYMHILFILMVKSSLIPSLFLETFVSAGLKTTCETLSSSCCSFLPVTNMHSYCSTITVSSVKSCNTDQAALLKQGYASASNTCAG